MLDNGADRCCPRLHPQRRPSMTPAITAMEAGRNVICEKPMEIQLDRIDRMIEVSKKNNKTPCRHLSESMEQRQRGFEEARLTNIASARCRSRIYTPWWRTASSTAKEAGRVARGSGTRRGGHEPVRAWCGFAPVDRWAGEDGERSCRFHACIRRSRPRTRWPRSLQFESGSSRRDHGLTGMYPGIEVRMEIGGANGVAVSEGGLISGSRGDRL